MKGERNRARERDPRTARSHVLGMKVAPVCSVVETSRKKYLVGKRRYSFSLFFVPTLRYSGDLEHFGERRCNFSLFFVPTLQCPGDLKQFGERRYVFPRFFVPTLQYSSCFGAFWRASVRM